MKLNRIISSLLAVLLVVSCLPALAATSVVDPTVSCNHNWKTESNTATCTQGGTKVLRCTICGAVRRENAQARGHAYNAWEVTTEPGCEQEGVQTHKCSVCGRTETRPIAALGHDYSDEWVITKEATVAEPGIVSQICSRCGATRDEEYYIALGSAVLSWNGNDAEYAMTLTCNFALPPENMMKAQQPVMTVYLVRDDTEIIQPAAGEGRTAVPGGGVSQSWYFDSREEGTYHAEISLSFGGVTVSQDSNWLTLSKMLKYVPYDEPVSPMEDELNPGAEVEVELSADYQGEGPLRAGDSLEIEVIVRNVGVVPLVFLDSDGFEGIEGVELPETLEVGEAKLTSGIYTVTDEDVQLGYYYDPEDGYPVEEALDTSILVLEGAVDYIYFGLDQANEPKVWDAVDSDVLLISLDAGRNVMGDLVIGSEYEKRFYHVGETVGIHYTITNTGPETLTRLPEQDFSEGSQLPDILDPGQSYSWTEQHTIKEDDLEYGLSDGDADKPNDYPSCIYGVSAVYGTNGLQGGDDVDWAYAEHYDIIDVQLGDGPGVPDSGTESALTRPESQLEPDLALTVTKMTLEPFTFDDMGNTDNVKYTLTVTNTGNVPVTVSRVDVLLPSGPDTVDAGDVLLDLGKSMNLSYNTEFNDTEVESDGMLHILFKAQGYIPEGKVPSNQVEVLHTVYFEPQEIPLTSVEVVKKETSIRKGAGYRVNETVTYSISVTNTSEYTIPVLNVWDDLLGPNDLGAIFNLQPQETRVFDQDYYYTVTPADLPHHQVVNVARVTWIDPHTQQDMVAYSNRVEVPVLEDSDDTSSDGRKNCVLTLTGLGSGAAEYQLAFCDDHAKTLARAEANAQKDSADPAAALGAWQEIRDAWKADLKEMVDRLLERTKDQAAVVSGEYEKFCAWADTSEALLAAQYPDEPQKAAREAAELYMRETTMLCYLLHKAPETPRPDSRVGNEYKALAAGANTLCQHSVTNHDGILEILDTLCDEHRTVDDMIDSQLAANADAAAVFTRAQQLYQDTLNADTMARYLAADGKTRDLILTSRTALDELMKARQALLDWLYPDDPAAVAEVLNRDWREALVHICMDMP